MHAGQVARMIEMRKVYKTLVEKSKGYLSLVRPRHR